MATDDEVRALYDELLRSWNQRDASAYSALFTADGSIVGFDGTGVETASAIREHLDQIFSDHQPATYVAKVREIREVGRDVQLLRSVVGMIPPGESDIKPDVNAVQALIAVNTADGWRIVHFQNTPAAYDGRPDDAEALTAELRGLLDG